MRSSSINLFFAEHPLFPLCIWRPAAVAFLWEKVLDGEPEKEECVQLLGFLHVEINISENLNCLYCVDATFKKQDWGMIVEFGITIGCLKSLYTDGLCMIPDGDCWRWTSFKVLGWLGFFVLCCCCCFILNLPDNNCKVYYLCRSWILRNWGLLVPLFCAFMTEKVQQTVLYSVVLTLLWVLSLGIMSL